MNAQRTGAPAECTCPATGRLDIVLKLKQTLACPMAWEELPGQGWRHDPGGRKQIHTAPEGTS